LTRIHRAVQPYAAGDDLALRHQNIGKAVAANLPRLHGPPQGGPGADRNGGQRPVGLPRANGEVQHYLRDRGLFVKVPPSWRELRARERKLQGTSVVREAVANAGGGMELGRAAAMAIDGELGCVGWPCGPDAIS
jgi:hypothetical protein